jgi:hypothetical protein
VNAGTFVNVSGCWAAERFSVGELRSAITKELWVSVWSVQRWRRPGWPPRVRYALTRSGHRLGPVLQALWDWGAEAP